MPTVFDAEGNPLVIDDPDELVRRFTSDDPAERVEFQANTAVHLRGPDGSIHEVRPDQMDPAEFSAYVTGQRRGWSLAGGQEVQRAQAEEEYGDRPVEAAALGLVRGATLGASDVIASELGPGARRFVQGVAEQNPTVSTIGEVGGALLPALLSGGGSAALSGAGAAARGAGAAARGAGLLTRGVRAAGAVAAEAPAAAVARLGAAVERGVAGSVGRGAFGRAAAQGAGAAAEGAIYGASEAISEAALGDTELTAEQLLAGAGMGALFGFGGGAAFSGATSLLTGTARGAMRLGRRGQEAIGELWQRQTGTQLREGVAEVYAKAASVAAGTEQRGLIRSATSLTPEGRHVRQVITRADDVITDATRQGREILDELERFAREVQDESIGRFKADDILPAARGGDAVTARQAAEGILDTIRAQTDEMMADAAAWGERAAVKRTADLTEIVRRRIGEIAESGSEDAAGRIFMELDDFKRQIGKASKPGRMVMESRDTDALTRFRDWYEQLRGHLEDGQLYGGAAEIQREVNAAWTQYLKQAQLYRQQFLTKVGTEGFNPVFTHDPGKLQGYLRRMGRADNDLAAESLAQHVQAQRALVEAIGRRMQLSPRAQAALRQGAETAKRFEQWHGQVSRDVGIINQFRDLTEVGSENRGLMSAAAGFAFGGPIGAAALSAVAAPAQMIRTLAAIERVAANVDTKIGEGIKRFFRRTGDAARGSGVRARRAIVPLTQGEYQEHVDRLLEVGGNPSEATARLSRNTQGLAREAPQVTAALASAGSRAVQFMLTKVPPVSRRIDPLTGRRSPIPPSDAEIARFERYRRAVEDPTTLIEDLEDGRVNREAVEAVRNVYPRLFEQIQRRVFETIAEAPEPPPYQSRIQLGIMFGIPTDPSLEPGRFAMLQSSYSTSSEPQQSAPAPQAPGSPQMSGTLSRNLQTETQRIAERG